MFAQLKSPSKEKLSIVVPIGLMAGRLERFDSWLESAIEAGYEIIIAHDIHDNQTGFEIRKIIIKHNSKNLQLIDGFFDSPGAARNAGMELCSGSLICFWDSDDLPNVTEISKLISNMTTSNFDLILGKFKIINEMNLQEIKPRGLSSSNGTIEEYYLSDYPGIWRCIFRRDFLLGIQFVPIRMAEDQLFLAEVLSRAPRIGFYDGVIYEYFLGGEGHLTKQRNALKDLVFSFEKMSLIALGNRSEFSAILYGFLARQAWTGLRRAEIKIKLLILTRIVQNIFRYPLNFNYLFMRKFLSILLLRVRSH